MKKAIAKSTATKTEKVCTKKSCTKKPCAKKVCTKKVAAKKDAVATVQFTVRAEAGQEVLLAGSFTDWQEKAKKMTFSKKDGCYTASVKLAPGEYQYKFIIGGNWATDDQNMNQIANDQGTFNSVVVVK